MSSAPFEKSSVMDINSKFDERLKRMDKFNGKRPINPFSVVSPLQPQLTKEFKPEMSFTTKLGAVYKVDNIDHVVDTKFEDTTFLDTYSVSVNPKAGHIKFTPNRLEVEHTREK